MKQFPFLLWLWALLAAACTTGQAPEQPARPNVLLIITDDQSYPHTSAYGYEATQTPGFDRIAGEGVLFTRAFAASPGCSPSRAALLTGLNCWQLGAAGTHASHFDPQYHSYPELLQQAGYFTGYTGKGWGPGNWEISGRKQNPAGPAYNLHTLESPPGISDKDYARNFEAFLSQKPPGQPFCFWMGGHEPHRQFGKGLGMQAGKSLAQAEVPAFLPDHEEIRADLLDYAFEIEWFDAHVVRVLELLEEKGELDNTLVIMTSDNGMAFPRAKANVYEYGIHVPLAIRWGAAVPGGRTLTDLVGFTDLAPTILEATGVAPPADYPLSGSSILPLLLARQQGQLDSSRRAVYASRERHSSSRYHSLGYPQRAMRTGQYLYIRNFKPERWPAGAPQKYGLGNYPTAEEVRQQVPGPMHAAYHDIDPCP
ncbi:MAG: heparan N-sulfatase, partial [Bacteroidetes bacterium]